MTETQEPELIWSFYIPVVYKPDCSYLISYLITPYLANGDPFGSMIISSPGLIEKWTSGLYQGPLDIVKIEMTRMGKAPRGTNETRCSVDNPWPKSGGLIKTYLGRRLRETVTMKPTSGPGRRESFESPTFDRVVILRGKQ